jgi:DHA1 family multidrug resistance protein-like MFS transporter
MESWKRNLYIVWAGCFLTSCGMGMVIPFLPMYVQQLGVEDVHKAAVWSSLIFGANHLMIVLVSPMWGRISDTYGQKMMMVRSGIVMAIVMVFAAAAYGIRHVRRLHRIGNGAARH